VKTDTQTIIAAMRILAEDIQSNDGVASGAIAEAADRLEELQGTINDVLAMCENAKKKAMEAHSPFFGVQDDDRTLYANGVADGIESVRLKLLRVNRC
jgi:hypothetical protein